MGMLEIRRSSARLDSLGGFRMPGLDNGSARAFAAQAEAASRAAAAAAGVAGRAKVEGIARRGQIVARTLEDLGRMAVELANRENERIATNAVLMSENDRNLYMTGDGTPENPGQFNVRQGKDGEWHAEEWLDDIKKAAAARRERFTKGLNGPQRRMYDEMVAKHDVAWNARIFAHAARTTMDAEIATATAALGTAKDAAIANFDVPVARERSIQEMYAAKEREMDVRQVPKGLRAAEMKALTEEFLVNFAKAKFTAWEVESANNVNLRADPEAVTKEWEEKGKALEGLKGTVIASEAVKKHLGGDTLDKVRQDLLAKEFNAHRAAAISRAYSLRRENWDRARMESTQAELSLHKSRPPEEPKEREAYFRQMAVDYGKLAENPALEPSVRLQYLKMAETLTEHSYSEKGAASRADAARRKAEIDANEERLATAFNQMRMLSLDGTMEQDEANETQAAIWRKFRTCTLEQTVSPGFMQTFQNRMETQLSDQEANAMRKFYRAFGYTPELKSDGEVGATDRNAAKKDATDYYAPLEENGRREESRKTRIKATELLEYGDSLLLTLRSLGPDINRDGVVENEISRLKSDWIKGDFKKNIEASLDAVQRSTILFKSRQESRPEAETRGDEE